jgi:hypothetical protein
LPEKVSAEKQESFFFPVLKTALLAAGGIAVASFISNCAFSGSGYHNIEQRDGSCRITGMKGDHIPLQAAHLYHDDGVLGGYNSPENGLLMTSWAHAFQHWLIYKWGVGPEFGLNNKESLMASAACLNTSQRAFKGPGIKGDIFPKEMTPLKNTDMLRIALLNASWLLGLQGICLGDKGQVTGHFCHGMEHKVSAAAWRAPPRDNGKPKQAPPISAIVNYRELDVAERMQEVEKVKSRLNGDGDWIMKEFVIDPRAGITQSNRPCVDALIARYQNLAF